MTGCRFQPSVDFLCLFCSLPITITAPIHLSKLFSSSLIYASSFFLQFYTYCASNFISIFPMASMRTQGGSTSSPSSSSSSTPQSQSQWKYKVFLSFRKKLFLNPKNVESCFERSGQSLWLVFTKIPNFHY